MKKALNNDTYKEKQSIQTKIRWENGSFDNIFKKKVICLETGNIYNSINEASNLTNTCRTDIGKCCRGETKTANKLHWIFYNGEKYTKQDRIEIINRIGGKKKVIYCIETKKFYNSIKEAAIDVGVDPSTLSKAIKKGTKSAGFHWKKIDCSYD